MAYDIHSILERIQSFEPRAVGEFREEFGAASMDSRKKIRASIRDRLSPGDLKLMDLDSLPSLPEWSISVSHCDCLGGWIAVPKPGGAGLDIELRHRISSKLVQRIAQADELTGIPDPALLWCAKESYYKALGPSQPTAVTQIRVENWSGDPASGWSFSGARMRGTSFTCEDLLIAVSLVDGVSIRENTL